jgi:hypothetical protein
MQNLEKFSCHVDWTKVQECFNKQFPASNRKNTQLRQHYQNFLVKHLRNGSFSLEEKQLFEELIGKDQKSLPAIAKVMNRTYQSVKN